MMKIKRLLFILMILSLSLSAFAQDAETRSSRIIISGEILNDEQMAQLKELADSVSAAYNFDLVVAIGDIGSEDPKEYADNFFERYGYGWGPERDGCLFFVYTTSDGGADFRFSDSGRGVKILTETAFRKMETGVSRAFMNHDLYEACRSYILDWEKFLEMEANGRSYNFFYRYNIILVTLSWVLALSIGITVLLVWKKRMNTALAQTQADAYAVSGSLAYKTKTDRLLFSKVTKIKKQKSSSSVLTAGKHKRRR